MVDYGIDTQCRAKIPAPSGIKKGGMMKVSKIEFYIIEREFITHKITLRKKNSKDFMKDFCYAEWVKTTGIKLRPDGKKEIKRTLLKNGFKFEIVN